MNIVPNVYLNVTNICRSCGFPVANTKNKLARYCQFPHYHNAPKLPRGGYGDGTGGRRGPCIAFRDWGAVKISREIFKKNNTPIKLVGDQKIRQCMGRYCADKEDRSFISEHVHNRICPSCSRLLNNTITYNKQIDDI